MKTTVHFTGQRPGYLRKTHGSHRELRDFMANEAPKYLREWEPFNRCTVACETPEGRIERTAHTLAEADEITQELSCLDPHGESLSTPLTARRWAYTDSGSLWHAFGLNGAAECNRRTLPAALFRNGHLLPFTEAEVDGRRYSPTKCPRCLAKLAEQEAQLLTQAEADVETITVTELHPRTLTAGDLRTGDLYGTGASQSRYVLGVERHGGTVDVLTYDTAACVLSTERMLTSKQIAVLRRMTPAPTAAGSAPRHAAHPDTRAALNPLAGLPLAEVTDAHDVSGYGEDEQDETVRGVLVDPRGFGRVAFYWLEEGTYVSNNERREPHRAELRTIAERLRAAGWRVEGGLSRCVFAWRPSTPERPCVEFFPVVVEELPDDGEHAPLTEASHWLRVAPAGEVVEGDLIVASFETRTGRMPRSDYFNDQYGARPCTFDPSCECGVCEHSADGVPHVVLSRGDLWESCDPWPVDDLALIVPHGFRRS